MPHAQRTQRAARHTPTVRALSRRAHNQNNKAPCCSMRTLEIYVQEAQAATILRDLSDAQLLDEILD